MYAYYTQKKYDYDNDETHGIQAGKEARKEAAMALDKLSSAAKAITTIGATAAIVALGFRW